MKLSFYFIIFNINFSLLILDGHSQSDGIEERTVNNTMSLFHLMSKFQI